MSSRATPPEPAPEGAGSLLRDSSPGQAAGAEFEPATRGVMPDSEVLHLHLLRHGPVEELGRRVVRGQRDVPLSARGREQGRALAAWFARAEPRPDRVLTSDLIRCRELAEEVARLTGAPLSADRRLREQSMGAWEGLPWEAITARDAERVRNYWADYLDGRAEGGESLRELHERVGAWWAEARAAFRGERLVVASHVGPIRSLLCHLLGVPPSDALRFAPATASHTHVLVGEAGAVLGVFGERPWHGLVGAAAPAARRAGPRRIALSGSAGTGKTTLGRRLAAELGLPFVEEEMRARLEAGLDVHAFGPADWRALLAELWGAQCAAEERACRDAGGFVADRSAIDYAAFWLHYDLGFERVETEVWVERMAARAARYERVVLCPWGALPLEPDGVRSTNRWVQLRFQTILEGLHERLLPPGRLLRVGPEDVDGRVRAVREALGA